MKISVGIPCYNEETTIRYALQSVILQENVDVDEIIICLSGTTDQTGMAVASLSQNNPVIKIIHSERGKPNAWNKIQQTASNRYLMWIDGDIILEKDAISHLVAALEQDSDVIAAMSVPVALYPGLPWILAILDHPGKRKVPLQSLWGCGYLIDNQTLSGRMRLLGYEAMPEDIIADGTWLSLIAGYNRIRFEPAARFDYLGPSSVSDFCRAQMRNGVATAQIRNEYGALLDEYEKERKTVQIESGQRVNRLTRLRKWLQERNPLQLLFSYLMVNILIHLSQWLGRMTYRLGRHSNQWFRAGSTKQGELLWNLYMKNVNDRK